MNTRRWHHVNTCGETRAELARGVIVHVAPPAYARMVAEMGESQGSGGVAASDHFVSEALYLHDPDCLGVEIYADPLRGTRQVSDGEIAMDTRPLDQRDLARAALNTAWNGMPAGTTMGHVHLHVGDLKRTDAFYHQVLGLDRVV